MIVIVLAPGAALLAIANRAVSCVLLTIVTALTVTPVPETATVAPVAN